MEDEIKKILDNWKYVIDNKITVYGETIAFKQIKQLLEYIINLQIIEQQYSAILSENAELENKITNLQEENEDYKSRCENATVILNNIYLLDNVSITNNAVEEIDKAINILQGVDKDE